MEKINIKICKHCKKEIKENELWIETNDNYVNIGNNLCVQKKCDYIHAECIFITY